MKQRMKQVQNLRRKHSLAPPFYCVACGHPKMQVNIDKKEKPLVKYLFFCTNCGFKSDEMQLRSPPLTVIDAFNKICDQYRRAHQKASLFFPTKSEGSI
jgi:transcription elongation factor Elf1